MGFFEAVIDLPITSIEDPNFIASPGVAILFWSFFLLLTKIKKLVNDNNI